MAKYVKYYSQLIQLLLEVQLITVRYGQHQGRCLLKILDQYHRLVAIPRDRDLV